MDAFKKDKIVQRIETILRARESPLSEEVSKVSNIRYLSRALREAIVEELGNEFCQKGLREDNEPNEYGLELEMLTDECGLAWE